MEQRFIFTTGESYPADGNKSFGLAGIDVTPESADEQTHYNRIEVYGNNGEAERIRDHVLTCLNSDPSQLLVAGARLVEAFEALLPGIGNITLQDYTVLSAAAEWRAAVKTYMEQRNANNT